MTVRWSALLIGTLLAAPSSLAVAASADVARDLASPVGPIVGSVCACQSIDQGIIVTQGVPSVAGYLSLMLDDKAASAKHAAGEAPDAMSLEGYISASILIQALKETNPLDTERLVDTLEAMRSLDLGLGTALASGRAEHQASHGIRGTALDEQGITRPSNLSRVAWEWEGVPTAVLLAIPKVRS